MARKTANTPPFVSGARPIIGHVREYMGDRKNLLQRGYREHGNLFALKLGPRRVAVLIGPEHHRFFYQHTDDFLNISEAFTFLKPVFGEVLFVAPHAVYLKQRPVLAQAFRHEKLLHYHQVMQQETQRWLDDLPDSAEFELIQALVNLLQRIAGRSLLGDRFNDTVGDRFWLLFNSLFDAMSLVLPPTWPLPQNRRRDRIVSELNGIMLPLVAERRRHPDRYHDFMQDFVTYRYPDGELIADDVVIGLMLGIVFAAQGGTPGQMGWSVIQLLQHPAYLQQVQAEIDTVFAAGPQINSATLAQLPHLSWAVRETSRMRPSIDLQLRIADRPFQIDGYDVPAGWMVQTAAEVAHFLPELFSRPQLYDPLRFSAGRQEDKQHRFALTDFGGGLHKCIGMHYALHEMVTITALLLHQFDLELVDADPRVARGLFLNRPAPTRIRVQRKKGPPMTRCLPYPNGWYVCAVADELRPGDVRTVPFFGDEIVLYRTSAGTAVAADAHCPHLGAHFGYGGTIEDELLRCPFHGFCFDGSGSCVKTGYGSRPPPAARLKIWPLQEVNGLLLVYYDSDGRPPAWCIPQLDWEGWKPLVHRTFELRDHPQEVTENSVDIGHFAFIHNYSEVQETKPMTADGAYMSTGYSAKRQMHSRFKQQIAFQIETQIYGLGYSQVDVWLPQFSLNGRFWVLPTPIDHEKVTLRLAVSVRASRPANIHKLLAVVPGRLVDWIAQRYMLTNFVHDAQQDFPIWENKKYISPPALAKGDGPIGQYRRWAQQFYSHD